MGRPQGMRKSPQPTPCHMLTRVNYVTGHLLSAEDFTAEQDYVREKLRRHNRSLHQPGVVDGLEVTLESPGVRVAPGFALDAAGNEICVPLAQGAPLPSIAGEVYLVLQYKEIAVNPIPVLGTPGEGSADSVRSRIQEGFEIGYDPPVENHTPSPQVRLARLRLTRGRWRVDARFRRPMADSRRWRVRCANEWNTPTMFHLLRGPYCEPKRTRLFAQGAKDLWTAMIVGESEPPPTPGSRQGICFFGKTPEEAKVATLSF